MGPFLRRPPDYSFRGGSLFPTTELLFTFFGGLKPLYACLQPVQLGDPSWSSSGFQTLQAYNPLIFLIGQHAMYIPSPGAYPLLFGTPGTGPSWDPIDSPWSAATSVGMWKPGLVARARFLRFAGRSCILPEIPGQRTPSLADTGPLGPSARSGLPSRASSVYQVYTPHEHTESPCEICQN